MDERLPDEPFLDELAPALDAWVPPAARGAFQDELRARFLRGEHAAGDPNAGDPNVGDPAAGDLSAALEAYAPRPRAEFRAQAREAFLVGGARDVSRGSDADESTELPELPELPESTEQAPQAPRAARATRTRFRFLAGGAVASLVAAAALLIWLLQPGTPWRVEAEGFSPEGIQVDGIALAADAGPEDLMRRLGGAGELRSGARALRLVLGDEVVVVELGPGSLLDLTGVPDDPSEDLDLRGGAGAFRIATGDGFRKGSQELSFRALDVTVDVTGTVFGVDVYGKDVCVCCCEGTVRVRAKDDSLLEVGETRYLHGDGRSDFTHGVEEHQKPLRALRDYRNALP